MCTRNRRIGFSLIELLVVVAIITIVAAILLTTMHAVWKFVRAWRAFDASSSSPALVAEDYRYLDANVASRPVNPTQLRGGPNDTWL